MLRRLLLLPILLLLLPVSTALAGGGNYAFDGGTTRQQAQVKAALDISSFDWNLLPQQTVVHIGAYDVSHSTPGHVYLDGRLLSSGQFSWPTVMDEFAHQIDFFLLDGNRRALLQERLGATAWCYEVAGLGHSAYGCERFSSMVAWAYWPSHESSYRPKSKSDETAAMAPGDFRNLLGDLIGAPRVAFALKRR